MLDYESGKQASIAGVANEHIVLGILHLVHLISEVSSIQEEGEEGVSRKRRWRSVKQREP